MRKSAATVLGILVLMLGVAAVAQAQNWIRVQGMIQAVDCQTNVVVLTVPGGTHAFPMAPNAPVFINSAPASLCTLNQYVGSTASVTVMATGSQLVAGRVDVFTAAAPVPPGPPPGYGYYGPSYGEPYCYNQDYGGPYYGGPYCNGPYSGYYPDYGPSFGFGIVIGPGFHHGDRNRRFVVSPGFRHAGMGRRFVVSPGFRHAGGSRR